MLEFLLFFLLIFIGVPLIKIIWRVWQLRRAYRNAQRQMNDLFNGRRPGADNGRRQAASSARSKKKIDPDVGEYVSFEEIKTTDAKATAEDDKTTVRVESQVEDAVWEDIR